MGSHFDAKRACPIEHALFLFFDELRIPSPVEGLKVSDRAQEARRNGPEPALSLPKGLSKGQKVFLCQHGFIFFDSSPVHFIPERPLI
jgi:hypothetical protein